MNSTFSHLLRNSVLFRHTMTERTQSSISGAQQKSRANNENKMKLLTFRSADFCVFYFSYKLYSSCCSMAVVCLCVGIVYFERHKSSEFCFSLDF